MDQQNQPELPKVEPEVQQQEAEVPECQPPVGRTPTRIVCPYCHTLIWTRVESKPSLWAWIAGIALACVGCVLCSCIPCCLESFQEITHFCPNCHANLGAIKPQL